MDFLVHLWNHSALGQRSLEDVIGIFGHQVRALGHNIVWDPENTIGPNCQFIKRDRGYNIIVEGFLPETTEVIRRVHEAGARFLCLATEEPTDKGFNHGTSREMAQRQVDFIPAMKYFDGILHLVPGEQITRWYSQFAPAAYAELGYARTLVRRQEVSEPEFDFGFFGSLSRRRMDLLRKLARRSGKPKAVRIVGDFPSQAKRDGIMQEAKVILQIRKFDEMGLVSTSRCNTALCIGRPVIAEPHDLCKPWDEVVKFARSEAEFIDMALMARGAWRSIHAGQFARFKEKFTPEICVGAPLRAIGVLPPLAAAAAA